MANTASHHQYSAGKITVSGPAHLHPANSALIPIAILHHQALSSGAKLVYSKLLNYAWANGSASNKRLASDLGISTRAVRNYVAELKNVQLLDVETHPGKPNFYTLSTAL